MSTSVSHQTLSDREDVAIGDRGVSEVRGTVSGFLVSITGSLASWWAIAKEFLGGTMKGRKISSSTPRVFTTKGGRRYVEIEDLLFSAAAVAEIDRNKKPAGRRSLSQRRGGPKATARRSEKSDNETPRTEEATSEAAATATRSN